MLVLDQDKSEFSACLVVQLNSHRELDLIASDELPHFIDPVGQEADRSSVVSAGTMTPDEARLLVRTGKYVAALIIPDGFGENFPDFAQTGPPVELLYDASNAMARPTIVGFLQASAFSSLPGTMIAKGFESMASLGWVTTPEQSEILKRFRS